VRADAARADTTVVVRRHDDPGRAETTIQGERPTI
jgi:hypothetical protein